MDETNLGDAEVAEMNAEKGMDLTFQAQRLIRDLCASAVRSFQVSSF